MKRIVIVCPHPKDVAPGQRLKYEQYIASWEKSGYNVDIKPFMTDRFWNIVYKKGYYFEKVFWTCFGYLRRLKLLFTLRNYDLSYIFLWVTPFGSTFFERLYCFVSKKIIYDIDDLVYHKDHKSEANSFLAILKGRKKPIYMMKRSDHVITCTPHLDSFVRKFNSNTTDISSTINTETYVPINSYLNEGTLTIGWSGSHSTSKYVYLLKEVLLDLSKKHRFKLLVIGDSTFSIDGLDCEAINWAEKTEVKELQRIDIGIYPLPNEEWVLGKSGLKALQYMALGIPTIATSIGANHRVIEDGVSGTLVDSEQEWKKALENYILNPKLRKEHGERARTRVESLYSIKANEPVYLEVINTVIASI
jgi:glycosyltransferase involved in cell wall biosynthesis